MSGADRGQLLGEGLFETILVVAGEPQGLTEHLARMERSAGLLGLDCPPDLAARVRTGFETGFAAECAHLAAPRRAVLRVTLTAGSGRGLVPGSPQAPGLRVDVSALPESRPTTPLTAVTVAAHRVDPSAAISGHKVLSWMGWIQARREALARGADVALVRTVEGDVCEADHANVFVRLGETIVTPSLDRGVLPGITRSQVLSALSRSHWRTEERALSDHELEAADEVWLTSSLDGVRSLARVDGTAPRGACEAALWLTDCVGGP